MSKPKIYPSSAAFFHGYAVKTTKHTSCFRFIGAQAHSGLTKEELRQEIPQEYQALGALDEYRYSIKLDRDKVKYEREVPFKIDFKGVTISGRMDFVTEDGIIIEKKSVTSETVYKRVFEGNQPEPAHVAQLASYLAFLQRSEGRLVVTYYEVSLCDETGEPNGFLALAEKVFVLTVDSGRLFLGQEEYPHTVKDLATWYAKTEAVLSTNPTESPVPPKPLEGSGYRDSPCNFCPLRELCQKEQVGTTLAEFVTVATPMLVVKQPVKKVKFQVNTKRRQENRKKKHVNAKVCD